MIQLTTMLPMSQSSAAKVTIQSARKTITTAMSTAARIGGSGEDTFVYKPGEGTDHITDFSGGDMLKILKTNGNAGGTYTSATFSGGNLTLAISGGGTVILDNVKSGQSININGTTKTISGNTLK